MNKYRIIGLTGLFFIFSFCKKDEAKTKTEIPPSVESQYAQKLKGAWIWDSTCVLLNDTLKYTYTPSEIKSYTVTGLMNSLCTTICNFTLELSSEPSNPQSSGTAYVSSYSLVSTPVGISNISAKARLSALFMLNDTTLSTLDTTGQWCVFPDTTYSNRYLFAGVSVPSLHKCWPYAIFPAFAGMSYNIRNVSSNSLVLFNSESFIINNTNQFACYFHK